MFIIVHLHKTKRSRLAAINNLVLSDILTTLNIKYEGTLPTCYQSSITTSEGSRIVKPVLVMEIYSTTLLTEQNVDILLLYLFFQSKISGNYELLRYLYKIHKETGFSRR